MPAHKQKKKIDKKPLKIFITAFIIFFSIVCFVYIFRFNSTAEDRSVVYSFPIEKQAITATGEKITSDKRSYEYYEYGDNRSKRGVYVLKVINKDGSEDYRYTLKLPAEIADYDFGPGVKAYVTLEDDPAQKDTVIFRVWMDSEEYRKSVENSLSGLFRLIKKHRPESTVRGEIKVRE
ncbi:MAG: hypothetical protein CVV21_11845 [Candidatus Goldiibacteriota bacterium HGW-Goldbacteria-1]|jgi:hypothetical protein|nr:MAG: hypothetical protein CVV21_11845 [Candidatus Goldiibacteriota bacterium HGW-Goldbacteria-1]